jgi:hypothetical protein
MWEVVWNTLIYINFNNNSIQWKVIHFILYTESRLQKIGKSNELRHFCKTTIETLQHLLLRCFKIIPILEEIDTLIIALWYLSIMWGIYIFILQSVHLLYKYAIRINVCFIRTRRINFSAYE